MQQGSRILSITTVVVITALLAVSAVALGAKPVKGATYKGQLTGNANDKVRFKVSANGKTVTKMHVDTFAPNKCGSGGPAPKQSSKPATIKNGTFRVRLTYTSQPSGNKQTITVTGRFLRHRKEKGTVINNSNKGTLKHCNDKFPYTTTAK